MKPNKGMRLGALLAVMLLLSMAFVPAVSAQAEASDTGQYVNAIDMKTITSLSEKDIKKIQNSMKILKDTDTEKIVSIKKDDGSIVYAVSWVDENTQRTNFAFVDKSELKSLKKLTTTQLNDESFIASTISTLAIDFWHGSYVETYGNIITGGVHIYLSPTDAEYVATLGALSGGALMFIISLIDGPLPFADGFTIAVAAVVVTVYWDVQNDDGSLDIKLPYASAATFVLTGHAFIQIGDNWYEI